MADQQYIKAYLVDDHGKWTVRARFPNTPSEKPKLHSKSTGFSVAGNNKRKAESAMRDIVREWEDYLNRQTVTPKDITFGECCDDWMATISGKVRQVTYDGYANMINKHIKPVLGNIKASELSHRDIQTFFDNITLKCSSVIKVKNVLFYIIDLAVLNEVIAPDRVTFLKNIRLPKENKREVSILSDDQIQLVFHGLAEEEEPVPSIIVLGLCYGLRRSEIVGLRWEDVDFEHDLIHIRNTVVKLNKGTYESEQTKTATSRRDLPIVDGTKDYLLELYQKRKDQGMVSNKVCATADGVGITPNACWYRFNKYMSKLGIEGMHPHSMRHTAATILVKRIPVVYASKFLGHSNSSVTLDVYSHVSNEEVSHATDAMANFISEMSGNPSVCSENCSEE